MVGEWNEHKSKNPDCGKLDFLTDETGSKVAKDRLKEISNEARILFNELYRYRHDSSTWSTRTAVASAFFSNSMRQKFPEFRWCEGDWKVHAFATARYPNWGADARDRGHLQHRDHHSSLPILSNLIAFFQVNTPQLMRVKSNLNERPPTMTTSRKKKERRNLY